MLTLSVIDMSKSPSVEVHKVDLAISGVARRGPGGGGGGGWGLRLKPAERGLLRIPNGPERVSHQAKLDAEKFGDEGRDQTGGLIESCSRLKFPPGYATGKTTYVYAACLAFGEEHPIFVPKCILQM